jgi:cysteine desulfurase/selenocysteine lyase
MAGLAAACRWLGTEGVENLHRRSIALARSVIDELRAIPGVRVIEAGRERAATFSFTVEGSDSGDIAARLDREHGLMVRAGLHCAPAAHRRFRTFPDGTLRVGIGPFTPAVTLERLIAAIRTLAP